MKIWITGFSRGGAVANVTAAKCTDSGRFQDVYAYTFAAPRTTRQPGNYRNIFNIIRKNDPVPKVPLADWTYQRYGVDLMIVSPDVDPESGEISKRTAATYRELFGAEMVMNQEINYQLRNIFDYILYLFPDSAAYTRLLQPLLLDVITGSETEMSLNDLIEALSRFTAENKEQEAEVMELKDLETLVQVYVLEGKTKDLPPELWDPQFDIENLLSEHYGTRYLAAMYASDDPAELFSENTSYVRLVIYGDVDAEVYDGDTLIRTVVSGEDQEAYSYPMVRSANHKTVISLAADRSYSVKVKSRAILPQVMVYSGNLYSGNTVRARTDPFYFRMMKYGETANIVTSGDGKVIDPGKSDFSWKSNVLSSRYTPSMAITMEQNQVAHLTIDGVSDFLAYLLVFLLIQLVVSVVLFIRRKKLGVERKIVVTAIWHGVNLGVFVFCELAVWNFIPTMPGLKLIPMVLALVVLLAFAWKLVRINRSGTGREFPAYAAALVAFGLLNSFLAGRVTTFKAILLILLYMIAFAVPFVLFRKQRDRTDG